VFGAHLASAVSLLFLLFEGRGEGGADVDVGFWLAPQAAEFKAFRKGPPRTALAWLPLPPSISPLFDATTIHNAPLGRSGDMFEAVISHFTFEAKKVESGGSREGGASPLVVVGTGDGAGSTGCAPI